MGAETYRNALDRFLPVGNVDAVLGEVGQVVGEDAKDECSDQKL